ncbi:MAG TPA: MoaD/ThiS family protein [Anaerolineales bacterium]|nr:MoaD/ThiS family protein [Anaerolineales bacterium]
MERTAGIQVIVRTFGLRGRDSSLTRMPTGLSAGTTVGDLLAHLRTRARPGDRLASVQSDTLLVLVNGRPIQYLSGWETVLRDGDEITCMLKTAGG